jgi:COP9 signalosome complex subunit 5
VNTLSSSNLITNADYLTSQINDLSNKLEQADTFLSRTFIEPADPNKTENKLVKATKDSNKATIEILSGFMSQTIKEALFNSCTPKNNGQ